MPAYDFVCLDCHSKFENVIRYSDYGKQPAACLICGSANTRRKINCVRYARSEESRFNSFDHLGDDENLSVLEENPQVLGRMMRKMSSESGEDMGDEFNEVVNRLEKGHNPVDIERDIPDLGNKKLPPISPDMVG